MGPLMVLAAYPVAVFLAPLQISVCGFALGAVLVWLARRQAAWWPLRAAVGACAGLGCLAILRGPAPFREAWWSDIYITYPIAGAICGLVVSRHWLSRRVGTTV